MPHSGLIAELSSARKEHKLLLGKGKRGQQRKLPETDRTTQVRHRQISQERREDRLLTASDDHAPKGESRGKAWAAEQLELLDLHAQRKKVLGTRAYRQEGESSGKRGVCHRKGSPHPHLRHKLFSPTLVLKKGS